MTESKTDPSFGQPSGLRPWTLRPADLAAVIAPIGSLTTAHGTVVLNANGTFTYNPTAGYSGPDEFWYTVANTTVTPNLTDTGKVTITIGSSMVWFIRRVAGSRAGESAPTLRRQARQERGSGLAIEIRFV